MNKKKKLTLLTIASVMILLGIGFFLRLVIFPKETTEWKHSDALSEYYQYVIYRDTSDFYEDSMEQYLAENETELEQISISDPVLSDLLEGLYLDFIGEQTKANKKYHKCLEQMKSISEPSRLDQEIWGRCYYELAADSMNSGNDYAAKRYIQKMNDLLLESKCYEDLIYWNSLISIRAYSMEGGADYVTELAQKNIGYAEQYGYHDMGYVYQCAADAFSFAGNQNMFIQYMTIALDYFEKPEDIVYAKINIGISYLLENDYKNTIAYILDAYETDIKDDPAYNASMKVYASTNLAIAYTQTQEYEKAMHYLELCEKWIQLEDEANQDPDRAVYYLTRAEYDLALNQCEEAWQELEAGRVIFEQYESFSYTNFDILMWTDYALYYYKIGDYQKAETYYKKCEGYIKYRGNEEESVYLKGLYDTYRAMGRYEDAMRYSDKLIQFMEKKVIDNTPVQVGMLEYENEKKTMDLEKLQTKEKQLITIIVLFIFLFGNVIHLLVVLVKRTKQIRTLNEQLTMVSERDGLTDLYNRRKLDSFLAENWQELLIMESPVTVAMIDVDFFKSYNDHYGHQKGDEALSMIAGILKEKARVNDFVARYGGEEFIVIMPLTAKEDAILMFEDIQRRLKAENLRHEYSAVSDYITISIGMVTIKEQEESDPFETAISQADQALYEAKKVRNTIVARE